MSSTAYENLLIKRRVAGALSVLSGIAILVWAGVQFAVAKSSARLPTTEGKVLISRPYKSGEVLLQYRYVVSGTEYVGKQIARGQPAVMSSSQRKEVLAAYPEGAVGKVYYDPADPRDAVLQASVPGGGTWAVSAIGLFLICFGGLSILNRSRITFQGC